MPITRPSIELDVLNEQVIFFLQKDMQGLARDIFSRGGLRELFEKCRDEVIIPSIDKNFEVGGRPPWEPLSPNTLGFKAGRESEFLQAFAEDKVRKPLVKTGQLRRAATAKKRFTIRNNRMTYGSWPNRRWFGQVHNIESIAEKAQIPWRPFSLFQREDLVAIQEIGEEWMTKKVNEHIRRRYG